MDRARRAAAFVILTAAAAAGVALIGAGTRAPYTDGSDFTHDLAAGAIVVGIVAAIAWAEHELEADATD